MSCHKLFVFIVALAVLSASAQDAAVPQAIAIKDFLRVVETDGLVIKARKLNIENAKLSELIAANRPNPSLSFSQGTYNVINRQSFAPPSQALTYAHNFEGPGKREARMQLAKSETVRNEIDFDANVKSIRLDAYNSYVDALKSFRQFELRRQAQKRLEELKLQTQDSFDRDLTVNEADYQFYLEGMRSFIPASISKNLIPSGHLTEVNFDDGDVFNEDNLERRPDIRSLKAALASAKKSYDVALKNRNVDVNVALTIAHTPSWISIDGAENPMQNSWTGSVTVPIPMSNLNKADLSLASNTVIQLELAIEDAKNKARTEIRQMHLRYRSLLRDFNEKNNLYKPVIDSGDSYDEIAGNLDNLIIHEELKANLLKSLSALAMAAGRDLFMEF